MGIRIFFLSFNLTDVKGRKNRLVDREIKPSKKVDLGYLGFLALNIISLSLLAPYTEPAAQKMSELFKN